MEEGNLPGMEPGCLGGAAEVAGAGFVEAGAGGTTEAAADADARVVTMAGGLATATSACPALAFLAAGTAPLSFVTVRFTVATF